MLGESPDLPAVTTALRGPVRRLLARSEAERYWAVTADCVCFSGASSLTLPISIYYSAKVLVALFVGMFRRSDYRLEEDCAGLALHPRRAASLLDGDLSKLSEQNTGLAQRLAILENRLEEWKTAAD